MLTWLMTVGSEAVVGHVVVEAGDGPGGAAHD